MPLIDYCLKPCEPALLESYREVLKGALHVALSSEIWPRDPSDLQSATLLRGGITLVDVGGEPEDLADDEGMVTLAFDGGLDYTHSEDLILADVCRAAPFALIWNLQTFSQGVEMFAIQRMNAMALLCAGFGGEAEAQILRDWILIAAFGTEATGGYNE